MKNIKKLLMSSFQQTELTHIKGSVFEEKPKNKNEKKNESGL